VSQVRVEPERGAVRAGISATSSVEPFGQVSPVSSSPRTREGFRRIVASAAARRARPQRGLATATVEPRWYSTDLAAGSTASQIDDVPAATDHHAATRAGRAAARDRLFAAATMIVAASLAVAVSLVVAPRLRSANPPAYPETAALIAQGANVYGASCTACHGSELKGAPTSADQTQGLQPPPLDASGHAWLHSDETLFRMVKYGIASCLGGASEPQMPSFGDRLDDRSIHAVLAFIKSRWPADVRAVQNAFNDGASDSAETQEAVLCTAICQPPAPVGAGSPGPNVAAR
jgi:mono/diheme cytochrome c family protein